MLYQTGDTKSLAAPEGDVTTRILVVDDDLGGLLALSEGLQRRLIDSVVDTAVSTGAALSLLRDQDYDAVVSDVRMGGMDGLTLLNQIRERWPETPVVMITGGGTGREAEALASGAFAFIEKPVDLDRLVPVLAVAMEKSLMTRRLADANRQSLLQLELEATRFGLKLDRSKNKPT